MATLGAIEKIGRPAKGRSVMKINRPLVRRAVKPLDKNTIFPGELAVSHPETVVAPGADAPVGPL